MKHLRTVTVARATKPGFQFTDATLQSIFDFILTLARQKGKTIGS